MHLLHKVKLLTADDNDSDNSIVEPDPSKMHCSGGSRTKVKVRCYQKKREEEFPWLGFLCKEGKTTSTFQRPNWRSVGYQTSKKKMREHFKSEQQHHACLAAHQAQTTGSIIAQFQAISQSERQKNRTAIKSLIRCTHFFARNNIAHTTNFDKLVDLVVACGGESLKTFLETAWKITQYTSKVAEFL